MNILALDPGTTETGFVKYAGGRITDSGVARNDVLLAGLKLGTMLGTTIPASDGVVLAIEMIASYGMPVGREVFETCVWIGRFQQAWHDPDGVRLVYRQTVKLHLCGSPRAKDPNVRQARLDRLGPQGTKKEPGPTYGVRSHAWAALGVAVTVADSMAPRDPLSSLLRAGRTPAECSTGNMAT